MEHCATCKHWRPEPGEVDGACVKLDHAEPAIYLAAGHTDEVDVYTAATFGCTLHEPKA